MNTPRYPNITVELVGKNGNAMFILGLMQRAMKRANLPKEEIETFMTEAMSEDYDNLLRTCMKWVNVE